MKTLKEKSRELSAARKEFEKHLREELVAFQEVALPQLEAIKALKDTRMSAVTQSPQYKDFNKKKISFSLMLGKFQKKYPTIPTYCIRRKFGSNYYSHRYSTPFFMLKRKFRLRKWY
jgi:AAA15 family ATPase/GTPase